MMGEQDGEVVALEQPDLVTAQKGEDGIWRDEEGQPLSISASDLERHAYCPMSWHLARAGVIGRGEAIADGIEKHKQIHQTMKDYRLSELKARREMVIWTWWFAIVVTLAGDTAAFFFVGEGTFGAIDTILISRYLVTLSLVWLGVSILLLLIPWRRYLGAPFGLAQPPKFDEFDLLEDDLLYLQLEVEEQGGWMQGGRIEVWIMLGSMTIALHGLALYAATERNVMTFVLLVATLTWTLFAAWRLHRALMASFAADEARTTSGLNKGELLAYSDDQKQSDLLTDDSCGLRGRPDQIVIIDNQFVPVEQKTGKIPESPHESHKMQALAYLKLVESLTNTKPEYAIIRYGEDVLFDIKWNDESEKLLMENISEIQRLMVEGGVKRNHERIGKCKSCSRRHRCDQSLA